MLFLLELLVVLALLVVLYLEIDDKPVPSFFLTSFILFIILIKFDVGVINLALTGGLFAFLLYELNFADGVKGIGDFKTIILASIGLNSLTLLLFFFIALAILGFLFSFIFKKNEHPFTLNVLLAYLLIEVIFVL